MNSPLPNARNNNLIITLIVILALVGLVWFLQNPHNASKQISNATEDASYGLQKTGRDLDPDRSVGQKIGDAAQDVGHDIDKATRD